MATGQNFHKSSLLGTLAYMGSPVASLRSEATSSGLNAGSLYDRSVMPLSVNDSQTVTAASGVGFTSANTYTHLAGGSFDTAGSATAAPPIVADYNPHGGPSAPQGQLTSANESTSLLGPAPTPGGHGAPPTISTAPPPAAPPPPPPVPHAPPPTPTAPPPPPPPAPTVPPTSHPPQPTAPPTVALPPTPVTVAPPTEQVTGDPHYEIGNTVFTHQGVEGATFLVASCDSVRVDGLYVKTNWDTCVIGIAQLTIAADPAHGISSHQILFDLQTPNQVTVDGKVYQDNSKLPNLGGGYQLTWTDGGIQLHVPVQTGNPGAGSGVYTIETDQSSDNQALEVQASGSFAGADGILAFLAQHDNIENMSQSALETYIDSHYNDNSSFNGRFANYAINYDRWHQN